MLTPEFQDQVDQALRQHVLGRLRRRFGSVPESVVSPSLDRKTLKDLFHIAGTCRDLDAFQAALRAGPCQVLRGRTDLLRAETAFFRALETNPDATTWHVFADWLEEHDRFACADFIRTFLALAAGEIAQAHLPDTLSHLRRLQNAIDPGWLNWRSRVQDAMPVRFVLREVREVDGPPRTLLRGILAAGTVRPTVGLSLPLQSGGHLRTWIRQIQMGEQIVPQARAGLEPFEYTLVLSGHLPPLQVPGLIVHLADPERDLESRLNLPVTELGLSIRVLNMTEAEGFLTARKLVLSTAEEIWCCRGIGEHSIREIRAALAGLGLVFSQGTPSFVVATGGPPVEV